MTQNSVKELNSLNQDLNNILESFTSHKALAEELIAAFTSTNERHRTNTFTQTAQMA